MEKNQSQTINGEAPAYKSIEDILREAEARATAGPTGERLDFQDKLVGKKRGRKPKQPEPPPLTISKDAFVSLVQVTTGFVAQRAGPQWLATPEECQNIGKALDLVAAKYFPLLLEYQQEFALAAVLSLYVLPRLMPLEVREQVSA